MLHDYWSCSLLWCTILRMLASAIVKKEEVRKEKSIGPKQSSNLFCSILKFKYSEKATKIWKKSPNFFWHHYVPFLKSVIYFLNFVAFSQYLNFQVHHKKILLLFIMNFIKISTYQFCINSLLFYILLDIFIEINSFSVGHSLFPFFLNYL